MGDITRPKDGTAGGIVFAIADRLSSERWEREQKVVDKDPVVAEAVAQGINASTAASVYSKWRSFYGLPKLSVGRGAAKAPASAAPPRAAELVERACAIPCTTVAPPPPAAAQASPLPPTPPASSGGNVYQAECLVRMAVDEWSPLAIPHLWARKKTGILYGVSKDGSSSHLVQSGQIVHVQCDAPEMDGPYEVLSCGYQGYSVHPDKARFSDTHVIVRRIPVCASPLDLSLACTQIVGKGVMHGGVFLRQVLVITDVDESPTRWVESYVVPSAGMDPVRMPPSAIVSEPPDLHFEANDNIGEDEFIVVED